MTKPPKPRTPDSAPVVWLKLIGLLLGLAAFCLLMFWLSSANHRG